MRVNHNTVALDTRRMYAESNMSKEIEKLSSGYRINRSADDAAGSSIAAQSG